MSYLRDNHAEIQSPCVSSYGKSDISYHKRKTITVQSCGICILSNPVESLSRYFLGPTSGIMHTRAKVNLAFCVSWMVATNKSLLSRCNWALDLSPITTISLTLSSALSKFHQVLNWKILLHWQQLCRAQAQCNNMHLRIQVHITHTTISCPVPQYAKWNYKS